eukprot:gene27031-2259_t
MANIWLDLGYDRMVFIAKVVDYVSAVDFAISQSGACGRGNFIDSPLVDEGYSAECDLRGEIWKLLCALGDEEVTATQIARLKQLASPMTAEMRARVGPVLKYKKMQELGRGGCGRVVIGGNDEGKVAIKMTNGLTSDQLKERTKMLAQEALVLLDKLVDSTPAVPPTVEEAKLDVLPAVEEPTPAVPPTVEESKPDGEIEAKSSFSSYVEESKPDGEIEAKSSFSSYVESTPAVPPTVEEAKPDVLPAVEEPTPAVPPTVEESKPDGEIEAKSSFSSYVEESKPDGEIEAKSSFSSYVESTPAVPPTVEEAKPDVLPAVEEPTPAVPPTVEEAKPGGEIEAKSSFSSYVEESKPDGEIEAKSSFSSYVESTPAVPPTVEEAKPDVLPAVEEPTPAVPPTVEEAKPGGEIGSRPVILLQFIWRRPKPYVLSSVEEASLQLSPLQFDDVQVHMVKIEALPSFSSSVEIPSQMEAKPDILPAVEEPTPAVPPTVEEAKPDDEIEAKSSFSSYAEEAKPDGEIEEACIHAVEDAKPDGEIEAKSSFSSYAEEAKPDGEIEKACIHAVEESKPDGEIEEACIQAVEEAKPDGEIEEACIHAVEDAKSAVPSSEEEEKPHPAGEEPVTPLAAKDLASPPMAWDAQGLSPQEPFPRPSPRSPAQTCTSTPILAAETTDQTSLARRRLYLSDDMPKLALGSSFKKSEKVQEAATYLARPLPSTPPPLPGSELLGGSTTGGLPPPPPSARLMAAARRMQGQEPLHNALFGQYQYQQVGVAPASGTYHGQYQGHFVYQKPWATLAKEAYQGRH